MRADQVRLERVEVDLDDLVVVASRGRRRPRGRRAGTRRTGRRDRRSPRARSTSGSGPSTSSNGNSDVVAPISAPMLQIVPLPVQRWTPAPGPKYSTMAPVPPLTVRISATLRMMSFGAVQPLSVPVSLTPMSLGTCRFHGMPTIDVDGVGAADADGDHAEAAGVGGVGVGADHHAAGERVVLEHDLVDDPAARLPEADAVAAARPSAGSRRPRGWSSLASLRSASAPTWAWIRWSQWTVVGTAASSRPASMNCRTAIWAVASCIATRSGR